MSTNIFFQVLDRANMLYLKTQSSFQEVQSIFHQTGVSKIRIISDDPTFIKNLKSDLLTQNKYKIEDYNTNFFRVNRSDIQDFWSIKPELKKNFLEGCETVLVRDSSDSNFSKLKDLILSSFGVDFKKTETGWETFDNPQKMKAIEANFEVFWSQPNYTFLVQNKDLELVGAYTLIPVGTDLQLYSVAGRSANYKMATDKKLPLLMVSMYLELERNSDFKNFEQISLSNSKENVAQIYRQLGVKENPTRSGLVVSLV